MKTLLSAALALILSFSAYIADFNPHQPQTTYIVNVNTGKFHDPECQHGQSIKEKNRWDYDGTREELIEMGFAPCKVCNP